MSNKCQGAAWCMGAPLTNGICQWHTDVPALGDQRLYPEQYWKHYKAEKRAREKAAKEAAASDASLQQRGGR